MTIAGDSFCMHLPQIYVFIGLKLRNRSTKPLLLLLEVICKIPLKVCVIDNDMTSSTCGCKHKHKGDALRFKKYIFNSNKSLHKHFPYSTSANKI